MATERQAKDGTVYQQVGHDEWTPVTRTAKDGTVYKKMGADSWMPLEEQKPEEKSFLSSVGDSVRGFGEGVAKSASLNTLPYLKAGVEKLVTDPLLRASGHNVPEEDFDSRVARARQQGKEVEDAAPISSTVGELAGFFVPGEAAAKAVGSGFKALSGVSKFADAASKGGSLVHKGARLAAEGALLGGAYTPDSGFTDMGARAEGAATGAVVGAIMPAGLHVAGKVAKGIASAPAAVGKKLLSSLGGVSEDVINRYLQDPERIRGAKTFDELYEKVSGIVGRMGNDLENSKINYDAASNHLDEVAAGIKDSRAEGREKALELVQQAKATLDEAYKAQKESLMKKASPTSVEPMVTDALQNLKSKISQGSQESYKILENDTGAYSVRGASKILRKMADEMNIQPFETSGIAEYGSVPKGAPITAQSAGVQAELRSLAQRLENTPERVPAKELKKMLQQLDASEKAMYGQPGFDGRVSQAYKMVRATIDEGIKARNPEYAAKMAEVAENSRLFNQALEKFGTPEKALNKLGNLDRTSAKYDFETLKSLAKSEGGDLPKSVDEMARAQRTLKSPVRMDAVRLELPQNQALTEAEMKAAVAKRLSKPKLVKQAIEKSAANFKALSAKAKYDAQRELFSKFKSFGEQGAESKLKQVAQGRKHAEKILSELSKYSDEDLVQAVKAAKDAAAFEKTMFNGSRNVNLWSVLGALGQSAMGKGGAGAAAGGILAGPMGVAVGGVTGAMVDVYGPKVTKQILDGVIKIRGPITKDALLKLNIPSGAKSELIKSFETSVLGNRIGEAAKSSTKLVADKEEAPLKGQDKWANDGFKKIQAHAESKGAIIPQSKETLLANPKIKKLMVGASDLTPGSKAMDSILKEIQKIESEEK